MEQKEYWVVWYPSYTHKDFELIDKDNNQPIIEDLTDSYFSDIHTYLKIETYLSDDNFKNEGNKKENIRLSYYKKVRKKSCFFRLLVYLFRKGILKDRPVLKPILKPQLAEGELVAKIDLIYKKHSSNGLFVYECLADKNSRNFVSGDQSLSDDKDQFPTFYCVKQLYHTHLFHRKSKQYRDYYFRAFLTKEEPNITGTNNESIKFYLRKILEYFELQLKHFEEIKTNTNADISAKKRQIENSIAILEQSKNDIITTEDKKLQYLKVIYENEINRRNKAKDHLITLSKNKKDKRNLYETSNNIVGETLFTNALCCSKYLNKGKDEIRKLLLNIENVKTGLHYIRDSYRYWYDRQESNKSLSNTNFWGRVGYIVGLFGIVLSIYFYYNPRESKQNKTTEIEEKLKNHIDSCFVNMQQSLSRQNNDMKPTASGTTSN
jgi:hypothetical protein